LGKWYLVRHAKTAWTSQGRVQGHSNSDIEAEGMAQAEHLAARLSTVHFNTAYVSDLSRTQTTAGMILKGRQVPLEITSELREMSYGRWEGMTHPEIRAAYKDEYTEYLRGDVTFVPSGGEGPLRLMERLVPLVHHLSTTHGVDEDLLLVSHGGTILLMQFPPEHFWRFSVDHASVSVVTTYADTATLDLWNDTSHLDK
jgi:broad specificity phosphatase PhoE